MDKVLENSSTDWKNLTKRFFARVLDSHLYAMLFSPLFQILSLLPKNPGTTATEYERLQWSRDLILYSIPIELAQFLVFETILLTVFGTTIGKACFEISVEKPENPKSLLFLKRAFYAHVLGMGLKIPIVSFFTMLYTFKRIQKKGISYWDELLDSKIIFGNVDKVIVVTSRLIIIVAMVSILVNPLYLPK